MLNDEENQIKLVDSVKKFCEFKIAFTTVERKLIGDILSSLNNCQKTIFDKALILAGGTESDIENLCKAHGFKKRQIDFCISAFGCNSLSEIDLADKFQIEVQSAKNKKQYYKKKLLNK